MKTFLSACVISLSATTAFAAPITLTVTELAQKKLEPGKFGTDVCYVRGTIENGSDQILQISMDLKPAYEKGSMTAMIAPAGLSYGNTYELSATEMNPGTTADSEQSVLGASCPEITEIVITPTCKDVGFAEIPCPVDVVLSPNSVLPLKFEGAEASGQALPEKPKGALDGKWEIKDSAGNLIASLNLIHPLEADVTGSFDMEQALCALEKQDQTCADGNSDGPEIRSGWKNDKGKVTIQVKTRMGGKVTFIWNYETGEGKVVNQRGTMNAPITATKM